MVVLILLQNSKWQRCLTAIVAIYMVSCMHGLVASLIVPCIVYFLCRSSMHEVVSRTACLSRNGRGQCQEDQCDVGPIQEFEAPELEVAADVRVRGGRQSDKLHKASHGASCGIEENRDVWCTRM